MKKSVWSLAFVLVLGAMVLAACGGGGSSSGNSNGSGLQRKEPPQEYASMTNPFEGQADAVTAGKDIYTANCQTCHGDSGNGDGPAGGSLDPKPANLNLTVKETNPQYQHWVVSEGGAAAGLSSSMPAFKGILSEDDTWKVINYVEATFGK